MNINTRNSSVSGKKKLLFVAARLPYPATEGHQIRTFGVLSELSKYYDIYLLSLLREGETVDSNNPLGQQCKEIVGVPIPSGGASLLRAGIRSIFSRLPLVVCKYVFPELVTQFKEMQERIDPDFIHLDLLPLAQLSGSVSGNKPIILNEHNIESALISQRLPTIRSPIKKLVYGRESRLLERFEKKLCRQVDVVLACSDADAGIIREMGAKSVHCIPNGVDVHKFEPNYETLDSNRLVFLGGMGWYPNRLGVQWFIKHVLPIVVKENPAIKLDLVGNPEPHIEIPNELKGHVSIHGFVDDFRPVVHQAAIMIVPLHVGSGTRLKVVEAAALGKCMVSTRKGAEGVMLDNGKEIVFADSAEDFARAILTTSKNRDEIIRIGSSAREVAVRVYDWGAIGKTLGSIYHGAGA
ncbi:MAG: glycosyltransferase family 4 protein [Colwellia sp.]